MIKHLTKLLSLLILVVFVTACAQPEPVLSLSGKTMGTTYHIKVVRNSSLPDPQLLQAEIDTTLERVNNQMSTYRKNSELSKFNRMNTPQSLRVSPDTIKVLKEGFRLYDETGGALDITLGPLINLWGFGPTKKPTEIPSPSSISLAKSKMGIDGISIKNDHLIKNNPNLYVDLSSIAKGFGVDKVAAVLNKYRVSGYLVEVGGEISVKGNKPDNQPWRVAIEKPDSAGQSIQQVIEPGTMSMATSGDYRNYFEEDGERFSHIIDPRTGYPIKHTLASATVLHKSSMTADGYATAMMVLGAKASLALANKHHLAVMLIEKTQDGYKMYYSDAFKQYQSLDKP
ncbi:FAD:protein FMN transferase [Shewanella intestini]|uniref:FAD:protein FMN transferase n=1 Tax=Shewanella intestini TaxID=2017544 RepID=A0ABS5HZH4_9GAMM|nr:MULTISPECIES: FAD:protein FMN transferase [Shewanella]MBR9726440.1 FAD:protein FMN transferase [Shewanella intestini]MRG34994.1 FAD:protein FMN transferase ApbE [Shewanella sp. XMDDZSB0408]